MGLEGNIIKINLKTFSVIGDMSRQRLMKGIGILFKGDENAPSLLYLCLVLSPFWMETYLHNLELHQILILV